MRSHPHGNSGGNQPPSGVPVLAEHLFGRANEKLIDGKMGRKQTLPCKAFVFPSGACMVVSGFSFKEERKAAFFPKLACWRDSLDCSLSERRRLKSVRALDSPGFRPGLPHFVASRASHPTSPCLFSSPGKRHVHSDTMLLLINIDITLVIALPY